MIDLNKISNLSQQKDSLSMAMEMAVPKETPIPKGTPIYVADIQIQPSKLIVRIEKNEGEDSEREFANTPEGHECMFADFKSEQIKGVRLAGKKQACYLLANICLKKGVRPLISNGKKAKNSSDKALKDIPVTNQHVAGIDIGKSLIVVAVPPQLAVDHTQAFGTFTDDLEAIVNWIQELGITEVAMESTSIYWVPLFDLFELKGIRTILVNPSRVKMIPGRKTDVLDAQWLMRLLACGLLSSSFIPPMNIRALRDLSRYRHDLIDRAGDCLNRMQKALSLMNIQISLVLSDISGKSGTSIIKAIVNGERNVSKLIGFVEKGCKCTQEEMERALRGTYSEENIFILRSEQNMFEYIHRSITETEMKIKELLEKLPNVPNLEPLEASSKRQRNKTTYNRSPYFFDLRTLLYLKFGYDLTILPGIDSPTAAVIIFETGGGKMDAFPTEKHFISWIGLAPGNKISGGKALSGRAPKKFSRVGQALRMASNACLKSETAIGAHLRRLIRIGKTKKTARKATAHKIGILIYNTMKFGQEYVDKGVEAYEKNYEKQKIDSYFRGLKSLGYVNLDKLERIVS
jgi:transposase